MSGSAGGTPPLEGQGCFSGTCVSSLHYKMILLWEHPFEANIGFMGNERVQAGHDKCAVGLCAHDCTPLAETISRAPSGMMSLLVAFHSSSVFFSVVWLRLYVACSCGSAPVGLSACLFLIHHCMHLVPWLNLMGCTA